MRFQDEEKQKMSHGGKVVAISSKSSSKHDDSMELEDPEYDTAVSYVDAKPEESIKLFNSIINRDDPTGDQAKVKEESIIQLAKLYYKLNRTQEFKDLFTSIRPFFNTLHKSRTAKIVRQLIDIVSQQSSTISSKPETLSLQSELCQSAIDWCTREKRTFLKQRIQTRLAAILVEQQCYTQALDLIKNLIRSVKSFDDKLLLVEIYLIESRCYFKLLNMPKSKGALTAARSNANSIYCPPALQSEIDLQAGILCAHDKDYKTAYSYFYEAYEGFNTTKNTLNAIRSIKYMILSKIMTGQFDDVNTIIQGKAGLKYGSGTAQKGDTATTAGANVGQLEIEAMKFICEAYKLRDIKAFESVHGRYKEQFENDQVIQSHIEELKNKLQESNLLRLIEPYSRVEIGHLAKLIDLPRVNVEKQLSAMIRDNRLTAVIDQNEDVLIIFDPPQKDIVLDKCQKTVAELQNVINQLYRKAQLLHQ